MTSRNALLAVVFIGLLIQKAYSFPSREESDSTEDDSQQQQQQIVNAESLEEFTSNLKTKGKVEKFQNETSPTPTPEHDPCLEEKRVGRCKAAVPRIFFNKAEGKCKTFIYGGCGGNKNNFKSLAECETICSKHLPIVSILPVITNPSDREEEICTQPPIYPGEGMCGAFMIRWTYNATQGKCQEYVYNGCRKTKNNFQNKQNCEATCGNYTANSAAKSVNDNDNQQPIAKVCNLPKDIGFCYAIKQRYYFNKRNNRCEIFDFGGCGGNDNNFRTAEECIRVCGGDAPLENAGCSEVDCPWELYTHYTTLDCKPIYDGRSCCPTRFDCPDKSQQQLNNTLGEARNLATGEPTISTEEVPPNPQCQYKGKSYNIGDDVTEANDAASCRAACLCSETRVGNTQIMCASIECPEQLGAIPPEKRNCIPLYKKWSCCSHDYYCPNDTLTIQEPSQQQHPTPSEPIFKCNIDGESFYEGQRFYPKQEKCLRCICGKGFDGSLSDEYCEPIDCGIEIYYSDYLRRGCAPVYYQSADGSSRCCPISWECPDKDSPPRPTPQPRPPSVRPPTTNTTREVGLGPVPVTQTSTTEGPLAVSTPEVYIPRNTTSNLLLTQDACELKKELGPCKGQRTRYFYDKDTNTCQEFNFSGCGGNANNFVSVKDCQRLCIIADTPGSTTDNRILLRSLDANNQVVQPERRSIYVTQVDPCTMPKKTGYCKGYFFRYYYSPEDNSCQSFIYGGCKGNSNNFYSKQSCEASCTRSMNVQGLRTSIPSSVSKTASSTGDVVGDASMVNFGEDTKSVMTGDTNPSTSSTSICTLPKKTGLCRAFVTRYYYDSATSVGCRDFVYGGCRGNANNFKTMLECQSRCPDNESSRGESTAGGAQVSQTRSQQAQVQPTGDRNLAVIQGGDDDSVSSWRSSYFLERCRLPMKAGSCLAIIPSYYYDVETNSCNFFLYSGCFGNGNRFTSSNECEAQCKRVTTQSEGIGGRMSISGLPWSRRIASDDDGAGISAMGTQELAPSPRGRGGSYASMISEEVCKLPPAQGSCKDHILRYHWDAATKMCIPFVWSGCLGNGNNFERESDCISVCGKEPTIEQLTSDGILSCTFGNDILPVGSTIRKFKHNKMRQPDDSSEAPCGVPVCQCLTPPSVTCFYSSCPTPPPTATTTTEKVCPTPSCGANCREAIGLDGCPTCDCDDTESQVQVEEVFVGNTKG